MTVEVSDTWVAGAYAAASVLGLRQWDLKVKASSFERLVLEKCRAPGADFEPATLRGAELLLVAGVLGVEFLSGLPEFQDILPAFVGTIVAVLDESAETGVVQHLVYKVHYGYLSDALNQSFNHIGEVADGVGCPGG